LKRQTKNSNTVSTFDTAGLSKYYAGVVAEVPLFSASEINTERRAEYQRRTQLSENVAALLKGLAAMRRAWREIGLYNRHSVPLLSRIGIYGDITFAEQGEQRPVVGFEVQHDLGERSGQQDMDVGEGLEHPSGGGVFRGLAL
jgi:hypothetical protein